MLRRIYLKFRDEETFLRALCVFVVTMLTLHFARGADSDWGGTNLTLSIEAAIASAVIMKEQKRQGEVQQKQMLALLTLAETQRDMLVDHAALLRVLRDGDARILETLTTLKEE
jgi:arginine/lysine/ornithine decarboxylase